MTARAFVQSQSIDEQQLAPYLDAINPGRNVVSILEYAVDVMALAQGVALSGDCLPWPKSNHQFRMRPGEVTLWHGINGHGKSAITSQVALWLALQGKSSCLASFEMLPERTLHRMVCQAAGNSKPSDQFMADFFKNLCRHIWVYDRKGRVDPNLVFAAIRYCAKEKGISHFFVDSLMKCVSREDDYGAQSDFVNSLCDVAHETGVHVHLIHHVRKSDDETKQPSKFDAKGTGAITDQVDNVLAVWRNKAKEQQRLALGKELSEETPDFLLICDKQRHGNWEGNWGLWGDVSCWHFREQAKPSWMRGYELPAYPQTEPGAAG